MGYERFDFLQRHKHGTFSISETELCCCQFFNSSINHIAINAGISVFTVYTDLYLYVEFYVIRRDIKGGLADNERCSVKWTLPSAMPPDRAVISQNEPFDGKG